MELIEDQDEKEALPEPEPRYRAELPVEGAEADNGRPGWLLPLGIVIVVAGVVVGLVFLARWIYHEVNRNNPPAASPSGSKQAAGAPGSQSGANGTSGPPASNNPSSPGNSSGAASGNQKGTASNNQQIANTGPGNVAAIFVGSSLAAAGLHFILSLRRFNKGIGRRM